MNFDRNAYQGGYDSLSSGYNDDNHIYASNVNVIADGSFYAPSFTAVSAERFNPNMDVSINNEARLNSMANLNSSYPSISSLYPSISSFLMTGDAPLLQGPAPDHHKFLYDQGAGASDQSALAKNEGSTAIKKSIVTKGQWSAEDDRRLVSLVEKYGSKKWVQIAQMLVGRKGKQCRERWNNHLKADIKKDPWNEEEERILIEAHSEIGNKWVEIAKRLPGRTENSVKNHWNASKRKLLPKQRRIWNRPKPLTLLQEYIKNLGTAAAAPEVQPATGNDESDVTAGDAYDIEQLFEQLGHGDGTVGGSPGGDGCIKSLGTAAAAPEVQPATGNDESDIMACDAYDIEQLFEELEQLGHGDGTVGGAPGGDGWMGV